MKRESWLPAAPESARIARSIVRDAAAERGLGQSAAWALMLATTEAFANAVQHGRACGDDGGIHLRVTPCEDGLCVEVSDCGSFDARARPAPDHGLGGRGLPLITAMMDTFELVPDHCRTRVRFTKRRAAAAA